MRYLVISFCKFVAHFMLTSLFMLYVLPRTWHGYAVSVPMWFVSFVIAFVFAELAFKTKMPGKNETALLLGIWMVVSLTLQIFLVVYLLGTVMPLINSFDVYIQYMLEALAILMSAYLTRRRKIKATFGEGLSE